LADSIKLEIVSPEQQILSAEVEQVTVPGEEGYFTVMGLHAPLMSVLKPGFIQIRGGEEELVFVRGGFVEVSNETVTILAEVARKAKDFDKSEIEEELRKAEKALQEAQSPEDRTAAQYILDSLKNLNDEAQNMEPSILL